MFFSGPFEELPRIVTATDSIVTNPWCSKRVLGACEYSAQPPLVFMNVYNSQCGFGFLTMASGSVIGLLLLDLESHHGKEKKR